MAKILPSDKHPAEEVLYGLGQAEPFSLKGQNKTAEHETDDRIAIGEAVTHPWLTVEYDAPEEQPEAAPVEVVQPLAVEAGKDQKVEVVTAGVAETLASGEKAEVAEVTPGEPTEPAEVFEDTDNPDEEPDN
jgi:hypothetical protein